MATYKVHFLSEALEDLEEIILYIAGDSQTAATRMSNKIINKTSSLAQFPKTGRLVPNKKMSAAGYRMLGIKPYIVFYRIIKQDVFIYRILHGAANYPLLFENIA